MSHCSIGTEATGGRSHNNSSERSVSGRDTRSVKRKWPMANRWPTDGQPCCSAFRCQLRRSTVDRGWSWKPEWNRRPWHWHSNAAISASLCWDELELPKFANWGIWVQDESASYMVCLVSKHEFKRMWWEWTLFLTFQWFLLIASAWPWRSATSVTWDSQLRSWTFCWTNMPTFLWWDIYHVRTVISWWASLVQVNAHDLLDKVTI